MQVVVSIMLSRLKYSSPSIVLIENDWRHLPLYLDPKVASKLADPI